MKKINYLLLLLVFLTLGCRSDIMNEKDTGKTLGSFSYKQVDKENIPQIMNFLSEKTNNFKIPLKSTSALNKTETVFGEINTDYILESTNEQNETYYVFSVIPEAVSDSKIYNLEVQSDAVVPEIAKVIVYQPTEDWILNGNGNFSIFSGRAYTYSLDGILETSVDYERGTAGPCDPNPCPDCPINPNGGGTGGGGGGPTGPSGPSGPTGPGMPTGCVGCSPGSGNPPTGGTSGGSCGPWQGIYDDAGNYIGMSNNCETIYFTPRLVNPCGGGGVVVAPPTTPCEFLKKQNANTNYKSKIEALDKSSVFNLNHETGFSENKNGLFADLPVSQNTNGRDALVMTFSANTKGYIHAHLNDRESGTYDDNGNPKMAEPIRMFSPADIDALMIMAQYQTDGNYGNLYGTMVSSSGNYTIKFTGAAIDIKTGFGTDDWRKKYAKYFKDKDGSSEKKFLTFLKEEMKINGVSLYKIKSNGTIQKKELGGDGKVKSTDCPV